MPDQIAPRVISTTQRVALLLGLALLLYIALGAATLRWAVFPAFERLERQDAIRQIEQIELALTRERDHLASFSRDWAFWDDSYEFVTAPHDEFIRLNLTEQATANTPTDAIAYYDRHGELVFTGIYRSLEAQRVTATQALEAGALFRELVAPLLTSRSLDAKQQTHALVAFGDHPMIAVAHPVLRSDLSGPAIGVLLMARLLDDTQLQALQSQTLIPFGLKRASSNMLPSVEPGRWFSTAAQTQGWLLMTSNEHLEVHLRLRADGDNAFDVTSRYDRWMRAEGQRAMGYALMLSTACFVVLMALIHRALLTPWFLRPLAAMSRALHSSKNDNGTAVRLPVHGAPELRLLAGAFNALMEQVEADREEISLASLTDELTRLPNRRRFRQLLAQEWHSALLQQQPLAVLLCDVDHFKLYNDHYGHSPGDDCLRRVAHTIQQSMLRRSDFAARYGGEEFVLVLPDTDAHGALATAERVLANVRALALPHATSPVAPFVTLSIGIYAAGPSAERHASEWITLADAALYRAKAGGRNRAELAQVSDAAPHAPGAASNESSPG